MRDGSAGVRIGKPTLDHGREGKLSDDLVQRAVLWLILDKADELFLGGTHGPIVPLLWGPANAETSRLMTDRPSHNLYLLTASIAQRKFDRRG
jgi:hypothetical protein